MHNIGFYLPKVINKNVKSKIYVMKKFVTAALQQKIRAGIL